MSDVLRKWVETLETRRLLANIGLDTSFGANGTAPVSGSVLVADVADGKIVAVGQSGGATLLNADDGSIDGSFHDAGVTPEESDRFAIVRGNTLLIAGVNQTNHTVFVRAIKLDTGAVDSSFGDNGIANLHPVLPDATSTLLSAFPTGMIVTSDGGIVVGAAQYINGSADNAVLYKLTSSGDVDSGFGNKGTLGVSGSPLIAALPGGGFVVVRASGQWSYTLDRRNNNGTLDQGFGNGGTLPLNYGSPFPDYFSVFVQPDGKILLDLRLEGDLGSVPYFVRLKSDGSTDTSFGHAGFAEAQPPVITFDTAGRIVGIAGQEVDRLINGLLDPSFDDDGKVPTNFIYSAIDMDGSGRVLVGGPNAVSRLTARDPVDLSSNGILTVDGTASADSIAVAPSGDSIVASLNGKITSFPAASVVGVLIQSDLGDDHINSSVDLSTTVVAAGGNDSIKTGGGPDIIACGEGNDTVDSGAGRDLIFGGDGNDSLYGNGDNDRIFGDKGNDSVAGGDGSDRLYGGEADPDVIDEPGYTDGSDSVSGNAGNDRCDGGYGDDRVAGNGGRDRLFGGPGDDRIYGGASGDWLYGDLGNDQLFGEGGADRLYADDIEGDVHGVDSVHGNAGNDLLITADDSVDLLFGDGNHDSATPDASDVLTSIEELVAG